jgi:hypothetical protein
VSSMPWGMKSSSTPSGLVPGIWIVQCTQVFPDRGGRNHAAGEASEVSIHILHLGHNLRTGSSLAGAGPPTHFADVTGEPSDPSGPAPRAVIGGQ